jgi:hypothetical protein
MKAALGTYVIDKLDETCSVEPRMMKVLSISVLVFFSKIFTVTYSG